MAGIGRGGVVASTNAYRRPSHNNRIGRTDDFVTHVFPLPASLSHPTIGHILRSQGCRHVPPTSRIVCLTARTIRGAANTKSFSCQESHLRKTWPSTAPPNAGPRTHDPISPTTLPTPMPVSTPSLPKAQFESENRLLHGSKGSHRACPQTKGTHNI